MCMEVITLINEKVEQFRVIDVCFLFISGVPLWSFIYLITVL